MNNYFFIKLIYKYILFLGFFLFISFQSSAQIIISYGIKIGAVSSYHPFENVGPINANSKFGLSTGLFGNFLNLKPFALYCSTEFQNKGAKFTNVQLENGELVDVNTSLQYISFSSAIKVMPEFKPISFYFFTGPRFDYLLKYDESILKQVYALEKNFNWGYILGLGLVYRFTKKYSIIIESKYDFDFTESILSGYKIGNKFKIFQSTVSLKNKSFNLSIGFMLNLN
jgi:hypothetical protein